jgi:hypothetical protein
MGTFTVKVPNNNEGENLGEYRADFLPRVGDRFTLWHPRVNPGKHHPFCGVVSAVDHEVQFDADGGSVETVVWLVDEAPAPALFCDCTEEERAKWGVGEDRRCESCGHARRG